MTSLRIPLSRATAPSVASIQLRAIGTGRPGGLACPANVTGKYHREPPFQIQSADPPHRWHLGDGPPYVTVVAAEGAGGGAGGGGTSGCAGDEGSAGSA